MLCSVRYKLFGVVYFDFLDKNPEQKNVTRQNLRKRKSFPFDTLKSNYFRPIKFVIWYFINKLAQIHKYIWKHVICVTEA